MYVGSCPPPPDVRLFLCAACGLGEGHVSRLRETLGRFVFPLFAVKRFEVAVKECVKLCVRKSVCKRVSKSVCKSV